MVKCSCQTPGTTWGLQEAVLALVFVSPFINIVDAGRERMFVKCLGHTLEGGAISTWEDRTRVQSYLEELKKLCEK